MREYVVTLTRVVECDDAAEAVERAIEEINGCGGLEALDFEVKEENPMFTVRDNVTGRVVSPEFDYSVQASRLCRALNITPGGRYGVYRGSERFF